VPIDCSSVEDGIVVASDDRSRVSHYVPFKRLLEVVIAAALLVCLLPVIVVCALLIKLGDGGRVLFWQRRVGQNGREFWFPKFRSMHHGSEALHAALLERAAPSGGITLKIERDPRVTSIGRVIRRLSIDEIPQLWCVLRGDVSLVGPRPPLPSEVAAYDAAARRRLAIKPGLTCLWQVSGRSTIPFSGQLRLDLEYIDRQSLWLDLKIIARTVPAVLSRRGAY